MAQSDTTLLDFTDDEEQGYTFERVAWMSAQTLIDLHPEYELSIDDIAKRINHGNGDSFAIIALKNAGVLVFWMLGPSGEGYNPITERYGVPTSMILPITERNLEAAHHIYYDEYDNPIYDDFLSEIEYFD